MVFICPGKVLQLGTAIGNLDEGAIITLNESASPVEFYIAKQDYESGLNGTGRVLLVRKDCYDKRAWDAGNVNAYATSDIDAWFNGTYKGLLDPDVQEAIGTTKFYYTPGNGNRTVTTLERAIFSLSAMELGRQPDWCNAEGSVLPISGILRTAYFDGLSVTQWTRSPHTYTVTDAWVMQGEITQSNCNFIHDYSRPCFTLPATFKLSDSQIIS